MVDYSQESAAGHIPNNNVTPALVNPPVAFVAPAAITRASGEVWVAVSCNDLNYGGCHVWASNDNASYHKVGTLRGQSTHGLLTAALATGSATDTVNTLSVLLYDNDETLESVNQTTVDTFDSRCYVGGEFLSYRDAVLTAANAYDLTYLKRGLYGSTQGAANGAPFVLLNDKLFRYDFNKNLVGKTVYFKFQAFNATGGGLQNLADVTAYSLAITTTGGIKALLSDIPDVSGFEEKVNKVAAWSGTPDDTHYPSEKLVKDSLDAVTALIPTTHYEIVVSGSLNEDVVYNEGNNKLPDFVLDDNGDLVYAEVAN